MEQNSIENKEDVVMIGDRKYDIEGARKTGIDSIGVLYGYGDQKELSLAGANYIVRDVEELAHFLLNTR